MLDQPMDPRIQDVMKMLGRMDARIEAADDKRDRLDGKLDTLLAKAEQQHADMRVYVANDQAEHSRLNLQMAHLTEKLSESTETLHRIIGDENGGIVKRLNAVEDFQSRQKYTIRGVIMTASAFGSAIGAAITAAGLYLGRIVR